MTITVREADPRAPEALACLQRYYAELDARFDGGFDVTLSADPEAPQMMPPLGSFLIAAREGRDLGCVGLKGDGTVVGEIKRLWVSPEARGAGLARRLMDALENRARDLGMSTLRLDTNSALPEAVALYRNSGWSEIPRFNSDPYPDVFFEKAVRQTG
ncbi:Acetyltransferase (GNAT) domain-containing protein [Roseivivax halotolerans]|uniref:Acetyltransferase (GNAT) domain-containing protein n=1 Tax=Roseivivax halotolerans TaxID=93684 RepID=A0A1I5UQM3_9RHOB|nr:GNAT family N-acetyltransferase [Roseivivax halotolerans]SFP97614.1 Acetyltransferase (GNAT) domain-containing protein [Roseivivax halotolerans]